MTTVVRIVHNLARSGGTIFARCLGCMGGVVLLSEIHPRTVGIFDPVKQAAEWHGMEVRASQVFVDDVAALVEQAASAGKVLVLRGWDHVDYLSCPHNDWSPSTRPELAELLAGRFEVRRLALVRGPLPMWASLLRHWRGAAQYGEVSLRDFLRGYRAYAEMVCTLPLVRYEDFCASPSDVLTEACEHLDLPFDPAWSIRWRGYDKVTGDIENQRERGTIERRAGGGEEWLDEAAESEDYRAAVRLLGY